MSAAPLLELDRLSAHYVTGRGTRVVRAVDEVSLTLRAGETLGVVGESGSGKTVLARSIMNLLPRRTTVPAGGQILFAGRDIRPLGLRAMRRVWGRELAMVFQDPMTSLNPVVKIGRQITEALRYHLDMSKGDARDTAVNATSWFWRWRWVSSKPSATPEQLGQPSSQSGPNMKW